MASNSIEDPSHSQELEDDPGRNDQIPEDLQNSQPTKEEERREKKRQADKRHRENKKQKMVDNEDQVKNLREEVSRLKERNEFSEKYIELLLDQANEFKEIIKNMQIAAGSQNDVNCKIWELLQFQSQILGGNISASANEVAYPQVEPTVTGNPSLMTNSFNACQSLPEERARLQQLSAGTRDWGNTSASSEVVPDLSVMRSKALAFDKLKEQYIASEAHHAQEKAALVERYAQEMAASEEYHEQEKAALVERYAQEMAAVRAMYDEELEKKRQELAGASTHFDPDDVLIDNGDTQEH